MTRVERHDVALAATLHDADRRAGARRPPLASVVAGALRGGRRGDQPAHGIRHRGAPAARRTSTPARRRRTRAGRSIARASDARSRAAPSRVHYLDFDRALHWAAVAPRELPRVLRLSPSRPRRSWSGERARAHLSHHRPLHATEGVVNRLLAERLGVAGRVDFLVPSFVVDRDARRAPARTLTRARRGGLRRVGGAPRRASAIGSAISSAAGSTGRRRTATGARSGGSDSRSGAAARRRPPSGACASTSRRPSCADSPVRSPAVRCTRARWRVSADSRSPEVATSTGLG